MSSSDLNFYINKHRKAYEERLKKELESQENKDNEKSKALNKIDEKEDFIKEKLSQVESDYLYALKLNESLNGTIPNYEAQEKNNFNNISDTKSNYKDLNENENNDDNVRKPDNTYVECLLEDNILSPYCVDYNYRNISSKSNSFNNNNNSHHHLNEHNNIVISSDDDTSVHMLRTSSSLQNKNFGSKNDSFSNKEEREKIFNVNNENSKDENKSKKKNKNSSKNYETDIVNKNEEKLLKKNFLDYSNNNNELSFSDKKKLKNKKISNNPKNYNIESSSSIQSIHIEKDDLRYVDNMNKCNAENSNYQNYDDLMIYNSHINGYESLSKTPIRKLESNSYLYPENINYLYGDEKYESLKNNSGTENINKMDYIYSKSKKKNNNEDSKANKNIKMNNIEDEEIISKYKNEINVRSHNNMNNEFCFNEKDLFFNLKEKNDKKNKNMEKLYKSKNLENKNSKKCGEVIINDSDYNYRESKNKRVNNILEKVNSFHHENNNSNNNRYYLRSSKKYMLNEDIKEMCDNKDMHMKNNSNFLYMNKTNNKNINNDDDNEEKELYKFHYYDKYENSAYNSTLNKVDHMVDSAKNKTNNSLKINTMNNFNSYALNNTLVSIDNNPHIIVDKDYKYRVNTENKCYDSVKKYNIDNPIFNHIKKNHKNTQVNDDAKIFHIDDTTSNNKDVNTQKISVDNIKIIPINKTNNKNYKNRDEISTENNFSYNKMLNYYENNCIYNNNNGFVNILKADEHNNKNMNTNIGDKKDKTISKNESLYVLNSDEFKKTSNNKKNIVSDKDTYINNSNSNINTIFIDDNDNNTDILINNKNRNKNYYTVHNSKNEIFSSSNNNISYSKNNLDAKNIIYCSKTYTLNSKEQSKSSIDENSIPINYKEYEQKKDSNNLNKNKFYNYRNIGLDNEKGSKKDVNNSSSNNYRNSIVKHKSDISDCNNIDKRKNDTRNSSNDSKEIIGVFKYDNNKIGKNNKAETNNNYSIYNNMVQKDDYIYSRNNIGKINNGNNNFVHVKESQINEAKINISNNKNLKNNNFDKNFKPSININRFNAYDYIKNDAKASSNNIKLLEPTEYLVDEDTITSKDLRKKYNKLNNNNNTIRNIPKTENNLHDIASNEISKEYPKYSRNYTSQEKNDDNNNITQNCSKNVENNTSSCYNEEITNDEDVLIQQAIINSLIDL